MRRRLILAAMLLATLPAACEREKREFQPPPAKNEGEIRLSNITPGAGPPPLEPSDKDNYLDNAYHISQGKRYFRAFNCYGCHGGGGGGSGPPLMDAVWIYGGSLENIAATIRQGRPNGMPSFRDKIPDDQIWEIAAYVRSMSGGVPKTAAPARSDDIEAHPSENRTPPQPPQLGGTTPPAAEMPQ